MALVWWEEGSRFCGHGCEWHNSSAKPPWLLQPAHRCSLGSLPSSLLGSLEWVHSDGSVSFAHPHGILEIPSLSESLFCLSTSGHKHYACAAVSWILRFVNLLILFACVCVFICLCWHLWGPWVNIRCLLLLLCSEFQLDWLLLKASGPACPQSSIRMCTTLWLLSWC